MCVPYGVQVDVWKSHYMYIMIESFSLIRRFFTLYRQCSFESDARPKTKNKCIYKH